MRAKKVTVTPIIKCRSVYLPSLPYMSQTDNLVGESSFKDKIYYLSNEKENPVKKVCSGTKLSITSLPKGADLLTTDLPAATTWVK